MPSATEPGRVSGLYRLGMLLMVFGGFLSLNGSGTPAGVGVWLLVLGFAIGIVGLLDSWVSRED